jgi:uncharacterized protein (TIGR03437 family)
MLTVNGQTLSVTQAALSCSQTISATSGTLPGSGGSGRISVAGPAACEWSASSNDPWLLVTWSSVNGAGSVIYSAPFNPLPAPRTGTFVAAGQIVTVTQEGGGPVIDSSAISNAASFARGPIAPGELIAIEGRSLGPTPGVSGQLTPDGEFVLTSAGGTRALFDDVPAPILYASDRLVTAVVPYAIAGRSSVELKIESHGVRSAGVRLDVAPSAPGILTINASGSGQAAVVNQTGTVNSAANPAARLSVIQIYATGDGGLDPSVLDGKITGSALSRVRLPVAVRLGNIETPARNILYAGTAPSQVAGVLQINVMIPANAPTGAAVPIVLRIGDRESPAGPTIAVR